VASFSALTQRRATTPLQDSTPGFEQDPRLADAQWDAAPVALQLQAETAPVGTAYDAFPAGSAFGTQLHDLLQWQAQHGWPAAQDAPPPAQTSAWAALLARAAQRLVLDETQTAGLNAWVAQITRTALPLAPPLQLGALGRFRAWPEMAFSLSVQALQAPRLDALIQQHWLPAQPREALAPRQIEGMLVGFMDLVLEHEGRYHVLDYKSNRLNAYDPATLQQAVLAHRYDVQAALYLLALHRLLRSRLPGYDCEQHLGSALVLFVRGIDQPGAGLVTLQPPPALIEALDRAFSGSPDAEESA
jgi:exodeoxyribonuclease V beta subunit